MRTISRAHIRGGLVHWSMKSASACSQEQQRRFLRPRSGHRPRREPAHMLGEALLDSERTRRSCCALCGSILPGLWVAGAGTPGAKPRRARAGLAGCRPRCAGRCAPSGVSVALHLAPAHHPVSGETRCGRVDIGLSLQRLSLSTTKKKKREKKKEKKQDRKKKKKKLHKQKNPKKNQNEKRTKILAARK